MIVRLASTTKIVEMLVDGVAVPARVWEGATANGIPVTALTVLVACSVCGKTLRGLPCITGEYVVRRHVRPGIGPALRPPCNGHLWTDHRPLAERAPGT